MLFMIACLVSGGLAIGLSVIFRDSSFFVYSFPGLIIGAFFGIKYALFDKRKARQEEHKRRRSNRH